MPITLSLILIALAALLAFKLGQRRTFAAAVHVQGIMEAALNDLTEAHAGLTEANEEMLLIHSANVGFVLDALDHHIAETGKPLDADHAHMIERIRPYYASETVH